MTLWTGKIEVELRDPSGGDVSELFLDAFMEGLIDHGAIDPAIYGSLTQGLVTIQMTLEAVDKESARRVGNALFIAAQPKLPGREAVTLIGDPTYEKQPVGV